MIKVPLQSASWLPLTAPYQWNTWLANIQMFHVMGHAIKYVKKKYSKLEEFNHPHLARPMIVWDTEPKILHAQNRRAANCTFAAFQDYYIFILMGKRKFIKQGKGQGNGTRAIGMVDVFSEIIGDFYVFDCTQSRMLICHCDNHGIVSELSSCLFTVCDTGSEVECILVTVTSYISPHVLLRT